MTVARIVALGLVALALVGASAELSSVARDPAVSNEAPAALAGPAARPELPSISEIDDGEAEAASLNPVLTR